MSRGFRLFMFWTALLLVLFVEWFAFESSYQNQKHDYDAKVAACMAQVGDYSAQGQKYQTQYCMEGKPADATPGVIVITLVVVGAVVIARKRQRLTRRTSSPQTAAAP